MMYLVWKKHIAISPTNILVRNSGTHSYLKKIVYIYLLQINTIVNVWDYPASGGPDPDVDWSTTQTESILVGLICVAKTH